MSNRASRRAATRHRGAGQTRSQAAVKSAVNAAVDRAMHPPMATVEHIDASGKVVKRETVTAERASEMEADRERLARRVRAQALGLWLPGQDG